MTAADHASGDDVLSFLVKVTNSSDKFVELGLGITLFVGGSLVCGKMIPHWQWFEENQKIIRSSDPEDLPEEASFGQIFSYFRENSLSRRKDLWRARQALEKLPQSVQQIVTIDDRVQYIHLADARIFYSSFDGIPSSGMLWRGKLRDVSGWSLGLLGPAS
jgi:hypothetical protein